MAGLSSWFLAGRAVSAEAVEGGPTSAPQALARDYPCYRLTQAPVLDGTIDQEVWQNIPEAGGFYILGKDGVACSRLTSFKVGWMPDAIHLVVRCQDMTPSLIAAESQNGDNLGEDDSIEAFFKPAGADQVPQFVANSIGTRWSVKGLANWQAKARVEDDGWTLELMIPFAVLGQTPSPGNRWLFNLARNNPHGFNERYTSWSKLTAGFNEPANFASLVFKEGPPGRDDLAAIEKTLTIVDPQASSATYDDAMKGGMTAQNTGVKMGVGFEDAYRLARTPAEKAQAMLYLGHNNYHMPVGAKAPARVRAIYERVLAIQGASVQTLAEAQYYVGMCYDRGQEAAAAKQAWEKVIAMPGASPAWVSESWVAIANLEMEARNYAAARPICQRVVDLPGASRTAIDAAKQKLEIIQTLEYLKTISREALLGHYAHEPLAVTSTNVMPSIQWLKPGRSPRLRVLFITYLDGIREVAQIAQRMELDPVITPVSGRETFLFKDYGDKYPIYYSSVPPGFDGSPSPVVQQEIERVLEGNYDALVLGSVNWSSFPRPTREKLLKKVEAGSTLIAKVSGMDDLLKNAVKDRIKPDLTFLFPYQGLPAFSQYPDFQTFLDQTVQMSRCGKGRIILLTGYDVPDYQMLTPGLAGNPDDMKLVDYDYYLAFVIHLLRYASGKTADCTVSGQPVLKVDRAASIDLEFGLRSKAKTNLTCNLVVRDRENAILATQQQSVATVAGRQSITFRIKKLPSGSFFADLNVLDGDKVVDFGSSWLEVTSASSIGRVNLKPQYKVKEKIKGTIQLELSDEQNNLALHIARRDNYVRVVSQAELPANRTKVSFSLPAIEGALSAVQYLDVELRKGPEVLDRKTVSFRINPDTAAAETRHAVWPESAGKDSYLAPYLSADHERCGAGRVLNNLVTELLNIGKFADEETQTFPFENPRDGWMFVSLQADFNKEQDRAWVLLGSRQDSQPIVEASGANRRQGPAETMRYLPVGKYALTVAKQGRTRLRRIIVRAIPELHFYTYPVEDNWKRFYRANMDWNGDFMRKEILPNVNVVVGVDTLNNHQAALDWKQRGRKWIARCNAAKLMPENGMPTVEEACKFWALGDLENPLVDGLIADELTIAHLPEQQRKFEVYCAAIRRIHDNPLYQGKVFYPFLGLGQSRCFQSTFRQISGLGFKLALERYLNEMPTSKQAAEFIAQCYDLDLEPFLEICATPPKHSIQYFCPINQTGFVVDVLPQVNFKVFLDMQFNYLANAPACAGLYGLGPWTCDYADEETMRWMAKLYRHYGLEGRRDPLSKDPYELTHLRNGDFAEGLAGWSITPAEEGSIKAHTAPELPVKEGRAGYVVDKGECVWMKRSAKAPNRLSQVARNLTPGRLYSLKFCTYDLTNVTPDKSHALSVALENAEVQPDLSSHVHKGDATKGSWLNKDFKWLNLHFIVFRAKSETVKATISDWMDEKNPGGPVGQELLYDFVQVQPYLEGADHAD